MKTVWIRIDNEGNVSVYETLPTCPMGWTQDKAFNRNGELVVHYITEAGRFAIDYVEVRLNP